MSEVEGALRAARRVVVAEDASRAAARAANRAGEIAIAYTSVDSPFGALVVAASPRGLLLVEYPGRPLGEILEEVAARVSPAIVESPNRLDAVRRELDEYFAGTRRRFEMPIDWRLTRDGFTRRVLHATRRIPYGAVLTYRDVAAKAGNERATRAAGNALGSNPLPIVVPCHRVVRTGGGLGGYTGGISRKERLLAIEGVR